MLAKNGALADMVNAGARILESACGPCIGMGQAPATNAVSLRTFNRNFFGRSGTASAQVYLVSPEVAAYSAIKGVISDPRELGEAPIITLPENFLINDNMIIEPAQQGEEIGVVRGPNIKPFPINQPLKDIINGCVLIKVEDNITTDHIMPSNAKLLPYRSNIPYLAEYCPYPLRPPDLPKRAKERCGGFIIGGTNYGQGSSREHAALAPLQLGIKGVIAKSFARIHMANLINNGILTLIFDNENDYDKLDMCDELYIDDMHKKITALGLGESVIIENKTKGTNFKVHCQLSKRQMEILLAGGLLNYTKNNQK